MLVCLTIILLVVPFSEANCNYLIVPRGQVTFDAEGLDNPRSKFFSRVPHVPSSSSGITIGRGYDMKEKEASKVYNELTRVGIDEDFAEALAGGAGLKGAKAKKYLRDHGLLKETITGEQQRDLFAISYAEEEGVAKRVVKKYTTAVWSNLHPKIQEIVVDLKFRGDLRLFKRTPGQMALKRAIERNNLAEFKSVISNRSFWPGVPRSRFRSRVRFLN